MERICVYPGSFDPITLGHVDIIRRSAEIFPRVIVALLRNPHKTGYFSVEKRLEMIEKACKGIPQVETDCFEGLLVDYMQARQARVVIRGLRAVSDFESEFQMAQVNHQILPQMETLFMMTTPQNGYISSSVVREIASFGGDISPFVSPAILQDILQAFPKNA